MRHITIASVLAVGVLAGCGDLTGNRAVVEGVGSDDLLKLRAGPGLGFSIIMGLPDGTRLIQRECLVEMGQSWCRVALAEAPGITGYVSEDYLSSP